MSLENDIDRLQPDAREADIRNNTDPQREDTQSLHHDQTDGSEASHGGSESLASTDEYDEHESFTTYKDKVLRLCQCLWPSYTTDSFLIEKMKGGSSNRIIGISVADTKKPALPGSASGDEGQEDSPVEKVDLPSGSYVLRVPRWGSQTIQHEIAMLQFVGSRISIDVPTVVHFDMNESSNSLGSPYVLQRRVLGKRLDYTWPTLNQAQRLLVALDMARLCKQLMRITNSSGGIPQVEHGSKADGTLSTIDHSFPGEKGKFKHTLCAEPPVDMLCKRLRRWGDKFCSHDETSPYYDAIQMVRQIQSTNRTFGDESNEPAYYLNHGDLFPRNIMIEVPGKDSAFISGILDWDDTTFTPAVIAFSPPAWMWVPGVWKDYDEEGSLEEEDLWRVASAEPDDQDLKEIKALFDIVVGPRFLHYAYSADTHRAQKIWRSAYETLADRAVEQEVKSMYIDWKANHSTISSTN